jgi:hypothetical protein
MTPRAQAGGESDGRIPPRIAWRLANEEALAPVEPLAGYREYTGEPPGLDNTTRIASRAARQRFRQCDRRDERYKLRDFLSEKSSLARVATCGQRYFVGNGPPSVVMLDGIAHFTGLTLCGSIWAFPVCAPRIRAERASEGRQR